MTTGDLEKRVRALEDIEEIKRLKARYCAYCDDNYNPDKLTAMLAEDAVWDGGRWGQAVGKAEIHAFFVKVSATLPFAVHMVLNPIIEVYGDTAKGSWYLFQACTFSEGNQALWGSGKYEDEYVRAGGEWKFKHVQLESMFWTPFEEGWVKKRFAV